MTEEKPHYITSFYLKYLKQNDKATNLPFIFPILFYTGSAEWKYSNEFEELVETKHKTMTKYVPKFKYFELFLNKLDRKQIIKVKNLLNQVIGLDLSNNLSESKETMTEIVKELIDLTIEPQVKEQIAESIGLFLKYFSKNNIIENEILDQILAVNGGKGMLAEKMEKWLQEIKEEGIKEGIEKGKQEKIIMVKRMLKANLQIEQIMEFTSLSIDEIEKIKEDI